jgi:hypothetical protein
LVPTLLARSIAKDDTSVAFDPDATAYQFGVLSFGQSDMARIVILGCAGSGKSTLAKRLGARSGTPVICLDAIWKPQWGQNEIPEFRARMKEAHDSDAWISEGNFAATTFDIRLPRATLVVWLERPKLFCAWHAITRVFRRRSDHCIGELAKVLRFIWNFDRINRPLIEANRIAHGARVPICRLTNRREIAAFASSGSAVTAPD